MPGRRRTAGYACPAYALFFGLIRSLLRQCGYESDNHPFTALSWYVVAPALAFLVLAVTWGRELPAALVVVVAIVLAVAVTVIEVALIVTLMVSGGEKTAPLARDTVFAAVMITCNGIVGLALLLGALRFDVTLFKPARRWRAWRHSPR